LIEYATVASGFCAPMAIAAMRLAAAGSFASSLASSACIACGLTLPSSAAFRLPSACG